MRKTRYVWEELSNPVAADEKGGGPGYYQRPRYELLNVLRKVPRRSLEVGCGGGATIKEMKLRYPECYAAGVELSADAANVARRSADDIIVGNVEEVDFADHGIAEKSLDTVFFPDVLEHLRDPWLLLRRIKPFLTVDAQIIASIPNVRNLWLLLELARGKFDYEPDGLLDVTHLRFFTLKSMRRMFEEAGYVVTRVDRILDDRTASSLNALPGQALDVATPNLVLKQMSFDDINDLKTMQFILVTTPR